MKTPGFEYPVDPNPPAEPEKYVWSVSVLVQGGRQCDPGAVENVERVWSTEEGARAHADAYNKKHGAYNTAGVYRMPLDFDGP